MYTVEEEAGAAKYGPKFKTAEYYLFKHLNGAGTSDCDHWHDGAGSLDVNILYVGHSYCYTCIYTAL